MKFAWLCSHESYQPEDLVTQAVAAEQAGFDVVLGSDHFHPWVDDTSAAGFVWSWLGAVAQATGHVQLGTAVTCPLFHYHPALVAQMAATTDRLVRRPPASSASAPARPSTSGPSASRSLATPSARPACRKRWRSCTACSPARS